MKIFRNFMVTILALMLFVSGCNSQANESQAPQDAAGISCDDVVCDLNSTQSSAIVEKLEIFHFHSTNQCVSCIAVGDLAEETVNTYFTEELKSGKIVFAHINGELPENRELVMKYGATGSSLWIGTYTDGEFKAEQNTNVWYKINDKTDYLNYLKEVIDKRLAGDMS